jgi:hypothetical protein
VYLACSDVVGQCKTVLDLPSTNQCDAVPNGYGNTNDLWARHDNGLGTKSLIIISTPYRDGSHFAKRPKDFIPIIDCLSKLHNEGFLHGDVRLYNTVFHNEECGSLIDYDFGGKISENPTYPDGYQFFLPDGCRLGKANAQILPWHDWYALGRLIFDIHMFYHDPARMPKRPFSFLFKWYHNVKVSNTQIYLFYLQHFWLSINQYPTVEEIERLKCFLRRADLNDGTGWIYKCRLRVQPEDQDLHQ